MTQVPWSTLHPAQIEQIVGVLLAREHPHSNRLRPGQGDGGIDVLVPAGDGRVDVYQIKSFAAALTPSQRSQIKRSLRRVADNTSVDVRDWYLTLPLNPTPNDLAWLAELDAGVGFNCEWFDLGKIDALAAAYQDVIDFYVHDGRIRLEATIERLRALSGLSPAQSDRVVHPGDLIESLRSVHQLLNRDDPHYSYDFHVTAASTASVPRVPPPTLVATWGLHSATDAITFDIHARYHHATDDRPLPVTFTVHTEHLDDAAASEWDRMLRYGTQATLTAPAVSNARIGLPFSLGDDHEVALLRIGPGIPDWARPYQLRLGVADPNDRPIAEVTLDMQPVTRGLRGGWRINGAAPYHAFQLDVVGDTTPTPDTAVAMQLNLKVGELTGQPPAGLRTSVHFLAALRHPNRLNFLPVHGPPVAAPIEITTSEPPVIDELVTLIDALADLQDHAAAHLVTPDLDQLEPEAVAAILRGARLVRGETLEGRWQQQSITYAVDDAPEVPDGPVQLHLGGDYRLQVGEQTVVLSPLTTVLLAATLTTTSETDDSITVLAVPALGNNTMLTSLVSIEDAPAHDVPPASDESDPDDDEPAHFGTDGSQSE